MAQQITRSEMPPVWILDNRCQPRRSLGYLNNVINDKNNNNNLRTSKSSQSNSVRSAGGN